MSAIVETLHRLQVSPGTDVTLSAYDVLTIQRALAHYGAHLQQLEDHLVKLGVGDDAIVPCHTIDQIVAERRHVRDLADTIDLGNATIVRGVGT